MTTAQRIAVSDLRGRLGPDRGDFPCRGFLNGTTFDFVTLGLLFIATYLGFGFICVYG